MGEGATLSLQFLYTILTTRTGHSRQKVPDFATTQVQERLGGRINVKMDGAAY